MNRALFLLLIAGFCVVTGMATWLVLAWTVMMDMDSVTPQTDTGGKIMGWALSGTLLMITGMIILHFAAEKSEQAREEEDDTM